MYLLSKKNFFLRSDNLESNFCFPNFSKITNEKKKKIYLLNTTMVHQVKSFSFVFLENLGHHKLLSTLTDL